jgi:hypothetical protein
MSTELQAAGHETATIRAFVVPEKQKRLLGFLAKPKTRKRFVQELSHFRLLDQRFVIPVAWNSIQISDSGQPVHGIANICRQLRLKGAGTTCWVISENEDFDGREMDLESAIGKAIDGQTTTILSCIPGKLALFVGETQTLFLAR